MFATCDDVLHWACSVAYDISFMAMIMRSNTDTGKRGRTSYVLISCERRGKYRACNKDLVQTVTNCKKCGYPFKLRAKPVLGGEWWMVRLICKTHNHTLTKSFVGHPYIGRLTHDQKIIIGDMTKSMIKPKNIFLTLKEHNANNCTIMKQVYKVRYAYYGCIPWYISFLLRIHG